MLRFASLALVTGISAAALYAPWLLLVYVVACWFLYFGVADGFLHTPASTIVAFAVMPFFVYVMLWVHIVTGKYHSLI